MCHSPGRLFGCGQRDSVSAELGQMHRRHGAELRWKMQRIPFVPHLGQPAYPFVPDAELGKAQLLKTVECAIFDGIGQCS